MLFKVPGAVFSRIAQVAHNAAFDGPEDARPYLAGVRIERDDSMRLFVVATNAKVMAVEYLDFNADGPPGAVTVNAAVMLKLIRGALNTVVITDGAIWLEDEAGTPLEFADPSAIMPGFYPDWRKIVPKGERTKGHGIMSYRGHNIDRLAKSSPSGILVFPDWINEGGPIIVRAVPDDLKNNEHFPNWFGMFIGMLQYGTVKPPPAAVIPDWLK